MAEMGRPRLYSDPDVFAERAQEYFDTLPAEKMPTLSGICLFMGFSDKESFSTYETYGADFSRTVKLAKLRIEDDRNQRLSLPSCTGVIFDLKNNHGWKDKTETEFSGGLAISHEDALASLK